LQRRHGVLVAALLTAVPFALAHWPLVLFTGVTAGSAVTGLIGYLVLGGIFRPMLAMLMRGAAGSVLLVAVLHSSFNRTNNANGIAAGLLRGDAGQLPMVLAAVVVAIVAALAGRGRRPQDG
jgi:membrane protease YdiL (CAAX protease family)